MTLSILQNSMGRFVAVGLCRLLVAIFLVAIAGCAMPPKLLATPEPEANSGAVVVSFASLMDRTRLETWGSMSITYRHTTIPSREGFGFRDNDFTTYMAPDFKTTFHTGKALLSFLPPGIYEIFDYRITVQVVRTNFSMSYTPIVKPLYRFEVKPGEITYLGRFTIYKEIIFASESEPWKNAGRGYSEWSDEFIHDFDLVKTRIPESFYGKVNRYLDAPPSDVKTQVASR